ncbi:MAG: TonB-dependent receptor [Bacteroidota bacterium]
MVNQTLFEMISQKRLLKRQLYIILGLLLIPMISLLAQQTVTGTVTASEDGTPLIGVTVRVVGSTSGTITDIDGNYFIEAVSAADMLSFSYVGYNTVEIVVGNQSTIDVSLELDITEMDEVVVVGYAVQKKKDLTGAISVVTAEDMAKSNATSLSKAMQGKAAGVTIMSTSGRPGAEMNIRIRGVGSINNDAQPLVVIDGVITSSGALNGMNPEDIETISILKDAAAAAIYGAQSSNGVILVETKKGSSGKMSVDFSSQLTLSSIPRRMDIMNADEYVAYYTEAYDLHNTRFTNNPNLQITFPSAYTDEVRAMYDYNHTDWQNLVTKPNALGQYYRLGISGGNETATYMVSGAFRSDEGILLNNNAQNTTIRVNTSFKLGKRITVGENLSFGMDNSRGVAAWGSFLTSVITSPLMPVYNEDALGGYQGPGSQITGNNDRTNPYAELKMNEQYGKGNGVFGSVFGEIELLNGLKFRTVVGLSYGTSLATSWSPKYDLGVRSNPTSRLTESVYLYNKIQWDQILTYDNTFGAHHVGVLAGHSMEDMLGNAISGSAQNFSWPNLRTLTNGDPDKNTSSQWKDIVTGESYFGRLTYDFKGKYLMTATLRRDGSSKFGPENKWGLFPSLSVGWKITEDFLQSVEWLTLLKLRFGYGKSGNTPDAAFLYDTYIDTYNQHVYTLGTGGSANGTHIFGAAPFYNFGSPKLQWEESVMTNIGLDAALFENRLQFSAEYYIKDVYKLLTFMPLQDVYGLSNDANPPMVNLGDVSNKGFEFNVNFRKREGRFNYSLNANLTTVKNRVEYLPQNQQFNESGVNVAKVGHAIGSYWGYVAERILTNDDFETDGNGNPILTEQGRYNPLVPAQEYFTGPGDIKFKDLNHDGRITAADQTIIGKPIPDFSYGLGIDLSYGGFDLNLHFQGMQNMDLYNQFNSRGGLASGDETTKDENKLKTVNNYWTPDNPVEGQTGIALTDFNRNVRVSSWWIEDASFFRLRNLQLGYTLPGTLISRIGIANLRIYVGGENLFVITKYTGYDPEVSSTDPLGGESGLMDSGSYPVPRVLSMGLQVNF